MNFLCLLLRRGLCAECGRTGQTAAERSDATFEDVELGEDADAQTVADLQAATTRAAKYPAIAK